MVLAVKTVYYTTKQWLLTVKIFFECEYGVQVQQNGILISAILLQETVQEVLNNNLNKLVMC